MHTAGPWILIRFRSGFIVDRPNNLEPVAEIVRASGEPTRETFEADARLMAAAPDLLAALERYLETGETLTTRAKAEAAIRRVRGGPMTYEETIRRQAERDARTWLEWRDEGETVDDAAADEQGWAIARMGGPVARAAAILGDEAWVIYSAAFRAAVGEP